MEINYFSVEQMAAQVGDDVLTKVRRLLNQEGVKLWEAPFTEKQDDPFRDGIYTQEFIDKYATASSLDKEIFITACEHLRKTALSKLSARLKYQETGVATLKIKPTKSGSTEHPSLDLQCSLHVTGDELVSLVSSMYALPPLSIKLIHQGKIICGDDLVCNQGVKHMSKIMCVCLSGQELKEREQVREQEDRNQLVEQSKQAAKKLAGRVVSDSHYFLEIQDQNGKTISLPPAERETLSSALALYEKGKVLMNSDRCSDALVLFCEADLQFNQCRSSILEVVDNYAILSLDLCWCYLSLQQISELSSADERLKRCETAFYRSYGRDLSRLNKLKNKDSILECALLVRLYLMQGIVAYHKDDHFNAKVKLLKAEELSEKIKVNETSLLSLVSMGFEIKDARLSLRVCEGDVMASIDHIQQRQEEMRARAERERAEYRRKLLQQKLGWTAGGDQVDVDKYKLLKGMGFPKDLIKRSLRVSNNDVDQAIQLMSAAQQLMETQPPVPETNGLTEATGDVPTDEGASPPPAPALTPLASLEELLTQLLVLGANEQRAREVIERYSGDLHSIVNDLFFSTADSSSLTAEAIPPQPEDEEVLDFVANWEQSEDYLDISLDQETSLLTYYKGLLS